MDLTNKKINKILVRIAKEIPFEEISKEFNMPIKTIEEIKASNKTRIHYIKVSLKIRTLMNEEKYDEALNIATNPKYLNNSIIQSQRILILINQNKLKEALDVCNSCRFYSDKNIQSHRKKITKLIQESENSKISIYDIYPNLNKITSDLRNNLLTIEDINKCNITIWQKDLLILMFYEKEKFPEKVILNYLKELIKKHENNEIALKALNIIKNKLLQKKAIFNIEFYEPFLALNINIEEEKKKLLETKKQLNHKKKKYKRRHK